MLSSSHIVVSSGLQCVHAYHFFLLVQVELFLHQGDIAANLGQDDVFERSYATLGALILAHESLEVGDLRGKRHAGHQDGPKRVATVSQGAVHCVPRLDLRVLSRSEFGGDQ